MAWTNRRHPQTLQIAVFLCYIQAFNVALGGGVLYGRVFDGFLFDWIVRAVPLAMLVAFILGGRGIANERKWGHSLAATAAIVTAVATGWWLLAAPGFWLAASMVFDGALVVLLFHPESRHFRALWFK